MRHRALEAAESAGRRGHLVRGDRSAHDRAAGHRHDPGERRSHRHGWSACRRPPRPAAGARRSISTVGRRGLRAAGRPARAGGGRPDPGAVRQVARGRDPAQRRADRRRPSERSSPRDRPVADPSRSRSSRSERRSAASLPRQHLPHDPSSHGARAGRHRAAIVGEAYAGDEDATLAEIVARDPRRAGAAADRPRTASPSSAAGSSPTRSRSTSCATAGSGWWRSRPSTLPSGTRSARRSDEPLWRLWGGYRDRVPTDRDRRLLRQPERRSSEEIAAYREMGLAGCKFKVGGVTPERGRRARARARAGGRGRLRAHDRRQPGLHGRRRRSTSAGGWTGSTSAGSRSPAAGTTTAATCATCARMAGSPSAPARAS